MRPGTKLATWVVAVGVALGTGAAQAQYGQPQQRYEDGRGGWGAPPQEFREIEQRGFHDGIEGARKDFQNHRRPNVNNRDEFRHPNVPGPLRHDYKEGFRRGYDVGVQHMMGGERGERY